MDQKQLAECLKRNPQMIETLAGSHDGQLLMARLQQNGQALDQAKEKGLTGMAAMCQLMCRLGEKTYYSKGSEKNLKLTTLDDIDIFKALLKAEKSAWLKA